jgi:hypothetical protein
MRTLAIILVFLSLAICGCDPIATARVRLQLQPQQQADVRVSVNSADTREALAIVDSVVMRHRFQRTDDYPGQDEHGFIRRYSLSMAPDRPLIVCYVEPTSTGLEIRFGEFGVWSLSTEAKNAADDVGAALVKEYGENRVR